MPKNTFFSVGFLFSSRNESKKHLPVFQTKAEFSPEHVFFFFFLVSPKYLGKASARRLKLMLGSTHD